MKKPYHVIRSIILLLFLSTSLTAQTISWEPINDYFYGMNVRSIGVAQNSDIYIGNNQGVIYRSANNGQTWIEIDIPDKSVINDIAGLPSGKILVSASGALYSSMNHGESWEFIEDPLTAISIDKFIVDDENRLFAATEEGVLYSEDEGSTWIKLNEGLTDTTLQDLILNPSGDLFAATTSGIFKSVNKGENWILANTGLTDTNIEGLASNSSGMLFARSQYNYLFTSSDNGDHWELKSQSLSGSIGILAFDQTGILYASSWKGISRSLDNGASWENVNGMTIPSIHCLKITPELMLAGTEGGIFISTDGENWNVSNTGLQKTELTTLIENEDGVLFAGSLSGIFRSTDAGDTWEEINDGLTNIMINDLVFGDDGYLFAATEGEGVWRSPDNGDSWEQAGEELQNYIIEHLTFSSDSGLFSASYREVFLSKDNGQSWETITEYGTLASGINVFTVNDSGALYIGTRDGIFISKNTGKSWEQKIEGMTDTEVRSIHFTAQGTVLVGIFSGEGYRSTNRGELWESLNDSEVLSLFCITESDSGHIYAGSNGRGIFRSKDDGVTWENVNQGLSDKYVDAILAHSGGQIIAGTRGGGVYRSVINPVGIRENSFIVPASITLEQNYPNPFNPETQITFRLGKSSHVSVTIYDSNGHCIRELLSSSMPAGEHQLSWNGIDRFGNAAASGIYICKLTTGYQGKSSRSFSRKMLLIR